MTALILKGASASRSSGEWSDYDYEVLTESVVVGRIFNAAASPVGTYSIKAPASDVFRSAPVRGEYLGASCAATRAAASSRSMKISANIGGTPTQHNSRHYTRSAAAVAAELPTVDAALPAPGGSHTDTWLCSHARGGDDSVREELATGIGPPCHWRSR
jgi:hypothetical protein